MSYSVEKKTKEITLKARVDQEYYDEVVTPLTKATGLNISELIRALIDSAAPQTITVTKNVVTVEVGERFGKRQKVERPL